MEFIFLNLGDLQMTSTSSYSSSVIGTVHLIDVCGYDKGKSKVISSVIFLEHLQLNANLPFLHFWLLPSISRDIRDIRETF
jgi:hypothetical protein